MLMPIVYKINVLGALKERGLPTTKLRKDKVLGESAIQALRTGKGISWATLERLCELLECQPADIIEYSTDPDRLAVPVDPKDRTGEERYYYLMEIWESQGSPGTFVYKDYESHLPIPPNWRMKKAD